MLWSDDEHQAIRQIAYSIWEKDGRPHEDHLAHWLLAESAFESARSLIPDIRGAMIASNRAFVFVKNIEHRFIGKKTTHTITGWNFNTQWENGGNTPPPVCRRSIQRGPAWSRSTGIERPSFRLSCAVPGFRWRTSTAAATSVLWWMPRPSPSFLPPTHVSSTSTCSFGRPPMRSWSGPHHGCAVNRSTAAWLRSPRLRMRMQDGRVASARGARLGATVATTHSRRRRGPSRSHETRLRLGAALQTMMPDLPPRTLMRRRGQAPIRSAPSSIPRAIPPANAANRR
jgi:Protein of unknown function (DUF2934)